MPTQKIIESTISFFWIRISMQKNSLFHLFILQIQSILDFCHQIRHTQFFTMLTPKISNCFLICVKMYLHAKNQFVLEI